jgi:TM2 domain-containing membrane protein YozV
VIRTLVLFAIGAPLLFFFDSTVTITAGILILFATIVSGVFATATPEFLKGDRGDAG